MSGREITAVSPPRHTAKAEDDRGERYLHSVVCRRVFLHPNIPGSKTCAVSTGHGAPGAQEDRSRTCE
eukprot:3729266-Rhodomonas_salina.1